MDMPCKDCISLSICSTKLRKLIVKKSYLKSYHINRLYCDCDLIDEYDTNIIFYKKNDPMSRMEILLYVWGKD